MGLFEESKSIVGKSRYEKEFRCSIKLPLATDDGQQCSLGEL